MKINAAVRVFIEFLKIQDENFSLDVDEFLKNFELEGAAEDLINECIEGYLRHFDLIDKVIELFMKKEKNLVEKQVLVNIFKAISYLFLFELDKIGLPHFELIISEFLDRNVHEFLKFLIENITGELQNLLLQFYDQTFVHDAFVAPLRSLLPDLQAILDSNEEILRSKRHKQISKPLTIVKPFNFTQPRDKKKITTIKDDKKTESSILSQEPEPTQQPRPKLLPKFYIPKSPKNIDSKHKTDVKPLICQDRRYLQTNKSEKTLKKMAEILEERERELQFDKPKMCDLPPLCQAQLPVKQNITAILREGALVQKKLQQQMKKVEELEQGAMTSVNFDKLQAEIQVEKSAKNLAAQEEKLLQGRLCREGALLARQKIIQEKQKKAQIVKEEKQDNIEELLQEKKKNEEKKKNLVHDVIESETRAKMAVLQLQLQKREITNRLQTELKDIKNKAKDESDEEIRHRRAIVQEIRALENISVENRSMEMKETTGRILHRMSLDELRERLVLLKSWQKEMEETKRAEIQAEKKLKETQLATIQEFVTQFRHIEGQIHKQHKREQENELKMLKERVRSNDSELKPLRDKLLETKSERVNLEKELKKGKKDKFEMKMNELSNVKNKYLDLL